MFNGSRSFGRLSDRLYRTEYFGHSSGGSRDHGPNNTRSNTSRSYSVDEVDPRILHRRLEETFRPLFQAFVYGGEQISNNELRRHLLDDTYRRLLPRNKLYAVMDLVDYNPSKSISYNAFVRIITGNDVSEGGLSSSESGSINNVNDVGILYDICRNTTEPQDLMNFSTTCRWCPLPVFMILISAAQIGVYIWTVVQPEVDVTPNALDGIPPDSPIIYNPARRYEVWRFVTYTFLHQGYIDLILTLVLQLLICFPVEIVFSTWRIVILYIMGVIAGSLLHSISDHQTGLAGGSGGTYCILAAHFGAVLYNWSALKKTDDRAVLRVLCHPGMRLVIIAILVICQVSLGIYRRFFSLDIVNMGIGHYGGGILAGMMLCEAMLRDRQRYPWQTNSGVINFFIFLMFVGACIVFNCMYKGYPQSVYTL